jgi:hypothetical protein
MHCSKKHLLNHLVGSREQRGWHVETERLGSLEIDESSIFVDCRTAN